MTKNKIYIKPSKRGSLRKATGTKKGNKIPASKLKVKSGDSKAMKKKKIFAQNVRKWKHPDGGEVRTNIPRPHTRLSIYPELVNAGVVNPDSLSLEQWNKLVPEDTLQYVSNNPSFDYTIGNTANPGGIKYWSIKEYPSKSRIKTDPYWKEKKNTQKLLGDSYPDGGQVLSGLGGLFGAIPTPLTQIFGAGLNFVGGIVGDNQQRKLEEDMRQKQVQQSGKLSNLGLVNPTGSTMAMGGLTPFGTDIEVEDGEVMRGNDGSMVEFNGPTHAQGGIDITAEPGSEIFGNLKVKSGRFKGLQYKDAASKIRAEMEKYDKLIS